MQSAPEAKSKPLAPEGMADFKASLRGLLVSLALFACFLLGFVVLLAAVVLWAVEQGKLEGRRMTSANNLKNIALAMHAYHQEHGCLPRAHWTLPDGTRQRSWRVALLPYIEQKDLFDLLHLDEPWNSEANLAAIRYRPPLFRIPVDFDRSDSDTDYLVITGPGTLFEEGKEIKLSDCTDGPANTIIAVESLQSGVHWAEPKDLDIRTMLLKINGGGGPGIRSPWKGGAYVAFADGSVRFLSDKVLASTLKAMITRSGGEAFEFPE